MSERHPDGYLKLTRQSIGYRDPQKRRNDFTEIYAPTWKVEELRQQGQRCMDCGVPTCMGSCPVANTIPDWNDLVCRGHWRQALENLHATNNFPEFTGYTCPAPCEPACVLALDRAPVTIKSIERAIVDKGWEQGWIRPQPPAHRSGFKVVVVGSGPAGLAAAQQLNRAGHAVTLLERDDYAGGLMTFGIPDFKFAKFRVARRIKQLVAEGITIHTGIKVGVNVSIDALKKQFDAVCLAIGALAPRPLEVPGRQLAGVEYAMPYLVQENRRQAGLPVQRPVLARGLHVVVLGGGDTGADCVATANRQAAASVTQVDINTPRPRVRPPDNPWPEPPVTDEMTYARKEGSIEVYGFEALAFESDSRNRRVTAVVGQRVGWAYTRQRKRITKRILAKNVRLPADLVLLATGFSGPETDVFAGQLALTASGTLRTDATMQTNVEAVFAAGDAHIGPSLVVWAIGEGRDVARAMDLYLTGSSMLPASLRSPNPPTQWQLQVGETDFARPTGESNWPEHKTDDSS